MEEYRGRRSAGTFNNPHWLRFRFLRSSPILKINRWKGPDVRELKSAELLRTAIPHAPAMDLNRCRLINVMEEKAPGAVICWRHTVPKDENFVRRAKPFSGVIPERLPKRFQVEFLPRIGKNEDDEIIHGHYITSSHNVVNILLSNQ